MNIVKVHLIRHNLVFNVCLKTNRSNCLLIIEICKDKRISYGFSLFSGEHEHLSYQSDRMACSLATSAQKSNKENLTDIELSIERGKLLKFFGKKKFFIGIFYYCTTTTHLSCMTHVFLFIEQLVSHSHKK